MFLNKLENKGHQYSSTSPIEDTSRAHQTSRKKKHLARLSEQQAYTDPKHLAKLIEPSKITLYAYYATSRVARHTGNPKIPDASKLAPPAMEASRKTIGWRARDRAHPVTERGAAADAPGRSRGR